MAKSSKKKPDIVLEATPEVVQEQLEESIDVVVLKNCYINEQFHQAGTFIAISREVYNTIINEGITDMVRPA